MAPTRRFRALSLAVLAAAALAATGCGMDWKFGLWDPDPETDEGSVPDETRLGNGTLTTPRGVAVDEDYYIYVTDAELDMVFKFDPAESGTADEEVWSAGATGDGMLEFKSPQGIAVDADGDLYVADKGNARVQKISPGGDFIEYIGDGGELEEPAGVAVDSAGYLYVSDTIRDTVVIFDAEGAKIDEWNGTDQEVGAFSNPAGIAVGKWGESEYLYVVDAGHDEVKLIPLDETPTADNTVVFGGSGSDSGQFESAWGIGVDPYGRIYVTDTQLDRVQRFEPDGDFLAVLTQPEDDYSDLSDPSGIAVTSSRMYIAEEQAGWVRIVPFTDF